MNIWGATSSPKRLARVAGCLYGLVVIFGGFAQGFVYPRVYAAGHAATTAGNVVTSSGLVRTALIADLFQATVFVVLAITLYRLLEHVQASAALAMVVLAAIVTSITCLSTVFAFEGVYVATDAPHLNALGTGSSSALVLLLFAIQHYSLLVAQLVLGLWLVSLGYLVYKSDLFPGALGVALIVGGVCYVLDILAQLLVADFGQRVSALGMSAEHNILGLPSVIAEIWAIGYLLAFGVQGARRAPAV